MEFVNNAGHTAKPAKPNRTCAKLAFKVTLLKINPVLNVLKAVSILIVMINPFAFNAILQITGNQLLMVNANVWIDISPLQANVSNA